MELMATRAVRGYNQSNKSGWPDEILIEDFGFKPDDFEIVFEGQSAVGSDVVLFSDGSIAIFENLRQNPEDGKAKEADVYESDAHIKSVMTSVDTASPLQQAATKTRNDLLSLSTGNLEVEDVYVTILNEAQMADKYGADWVDNLKSLDD